MLKEVPLGKLIRLCSSISSSPDLLQELQQEIESGSRSSPLQSMIKSQLAASDLENLGFPADLLSLFFFPKTITEIDLYSDSNLGIKCFFMSEGTFFPIHDHPNQVVITGVLYGTIKFLNLNKTQDPELMIVSKKGVGKPGNIFFNTKNYNNAHSILALRNTVIIDIFMHDIKEPGDYFIVKEKVGKNIRVAVDNHVFFLTRSFSVNECECHQLEKIKID